MTLTRLLFTFLAVLGITLFLGIISFTLYLDDFYITPDMQLHEYQGEVISMDLNHAMTTVFCKANGYNTAEQWIIRDNMYKQRVGYNIWGGDGRFNANDRRVHIDCKGRAIQNTVHSIQDVQLWLMRINVSTNYTQLSNTTYDLYCQQFDGHFNEKDENKIVCSRFYDIVNEYTPQEIARWYIKKGLHET